MFIKDKIDDYFLGIKDHAITPIEQSNHDNLVRVQKAKTRSLLQYQVHKILKELR